MTVRVNETRLWETLMAMGRIGETAAQVLAETLVSAANGEIAFGA